MYAKYLTKSKTSEKALKNFRDMVRKDPSLLRARSTNEGEESMDGWTPMHTVASKGNVQLLSVLIELDKAEREAAVAKNNKSSVLCYESLLDLKDTRGRTALHIACTKGRVDCARLLKEAMQAYSSSDDAYNPVGSNAPVDLSGRTPIGWAAAEAERDSSVRSALPELTTLLYEPGDWSVCPKTPVKDRGTDDDGAADELAFGFGDLPGWRVDMEDSVCCHYPVEEGSGFGLFGVFDGHGGSDVSTHIGDHFCSFLTKTRSWKRETPDDGVFPVAALTECCLDIDAAMRAAEEPPFKGGSTGIVGLITDTFIHVCNVGDSRAILVRSASDGGGAIETTPMSHDHKPSMEGEEERVVAAGLEIYKGEENDDGIFVEASTWKVKRAKNEMLAMSRAFGDFVYKKSEKEGLTLWQEAVVSTPTILSEARSETDKWLVLACDGIWDVMSNEECGAFVDAKYNEICADKASSDLSVGQVMAKVCDELCQECLRKGSSDNMTAMIVKMNGNVHKMENLLMK
jgi:protein phosphatase 1B